MFIITKNASDFYCNLNMTVNGFSRGKSFSENIFSAKPLIAVTFCWMLSKVRSGGYHYVPSRLKNVHVVILNSNLVIMSVFFLFVEEHFAASVGPIHEMNGILVAHEALFVWPVVLFYSESFCFQFVEHIISSNSSFWWRYRNISGRTIGIGLSQHSPETKRAAVAFPSNRFQTSLQWNQRRGGLSSGLKASWFWRCINIGAKVSTILHSMFL